MADIEGHCDDRFTVDLWGGTIDDDGTPWAEDTIINVWSTTKTMTALSALVLADRGDRPFGGQGPVAAVPRGRDRRGTDPLAAFMSVMGD